LEERALLIDASMSEKAIFQQSATICNGCHRALGIVGTNVLQEEFRAFRKYRLRRPETVHGLFYIGRAQKELSAEYPFPADVEPLGRVSCPIYKPKGMEYHRLQ
jgi:hypothetical protein